MNTPNPGSIAVRTPPESYAPMLKESIDHFLADFRRGTSNFSAFRAIFFRLFQTMQDPPLEVIWFYSAITYYSSKSTLEDPSKELLNAKDMFQLLVSCSSPSTGSRKVAVLAPVVYVLYNLVYDTSKSRFCSRKEIEGLVEGIISYISICCTNYSEEDEKVHVVCFSDLVRVWTVDRVGEDCKFGDNLRMFLPLLSEEICLGVIDDIGVEYLAGIVMIEVFLLSLCLKFGPGDSTDELLKDIRSWAVQIIKGFHCRYFLDMLHRLLLEPSLPVTTILKPGEELIIRKALYDAVILEGYSFLNLGRLTQQLDGIALLNLSLLWLLVANNAIQFVSDNGDHMRVTSYSDAFSVADLRNQLIKWVTSVVDDNLSRPKSSTPKALIKWLLVSEDRGLRIFSDNFLKLHAKTAVIPNPKVENQSVSEGANRENEGSGGDQEMVDTSTEGRRKREGDCLVNEALTRIKLVKYNNFNEH